VFIYLDSVPLSASGWPNINTGLKALVEAAALAQPAATIFIPEPVALEQEAQFMRDWVLGVRAVRNSEKTIKGLLARARLEPPQPAQLPTPDQLRAAYRASVTASMQELTIQAVPLIDRNVRPIFEALLVRHPPFDETGRGLGDTLILEAVVSHLEQHDDVPAILVTTDKDYKGAPALSGALGHRLRLLPLEKASAVLVDQAQADVRRTIAVTIYAAKESLKDNFASLDEYLAATVEIPAWLVVDPGESVIRVEKLTATHVYKIDVFPLNPTADMPVKFGATVEVKIELTLEGMPPSPLPMYKVGEDWRKKVERELLLERLQAGPEAGRPITREKDERAVVRVNGTAVRRAEGFTDWSWISATVENWL
jgi:hypothetical protein